ncbi:hypothetical protein Pmani_010758 [Petrolisthes manimaculis]|uniref:Uncharacterized protein n=1 Tax=Petrolisthes manimaculis TaxID=1843537 RepID=A0AAE1Q219_9EUCA|nr:hypothetical protein Pmani_010758 [Petrolisthes manimaculis]
MSFVALTLQFALHGCLACVLIHGVRKNRVGYVWAWIWARSVELITDASRLLHITALNTDYVPFSICFIASFITCFNIVVVRSYAFHMGVWRSRKALVSSGPRRVSVYKSVRATGYTSRLTSVVIVEAPYNSVFVER